ncbi:carbohydrate porin [Sphingomonas sp.]|uniref:carbohydrate porin n=1 Tax=Sphingomonas sp. TaxID=28214 RepID=UPI0031CE8EDD
MLFSALALAAVSPAEAPEPQDGTRPHSHTHAPAEIEEAHGPLLLQLTYTSEVIASAAGGIERGARYLDNLDLVFEADLERIAGWTGAQLHLYGLYNNGNTISDLVGDSHAVSNIETGVRALRLYEAWIDQKFGERVSLRAGLYDLNSEFDALDASGLFVGSAHGIGTDFSQTGRNGPSIFPSTSLAARLQVEPATGWVVRAAVLDAVPGDPARPGRTVIRLREDEGALLVGELQAPLGTGGKLLLGHWRYTAPFDLADGSGTAAGNAGTYIRAELPLSAAPGRRIDSFARLGTAAGRFNMFDFFLSAGLKFTGWIPGRDADEFGIALAAGFTAEPYRTATGATAAEIAVEATWRTQLAPWLAVQPHAQYIRRPSADPTIPDALVLGIRTEIGIDLFDL